MIDVIDKRSRAWDGRRAVLWACAALPIAIGWIVGVLLYSVAFVWQAFLAGYRKGRGIDERS